MVEENWKQIESLLNSKDSELFLLGKSMIESDKEFCEKHNIISVYSYYDGTIFFITEDNKMMFLHTLGFDKPKFFTFKLYD